MTTRVTELFGIEYPIIAGGMVWCSGWRLASAVSNAGGIGLLGAGSMHPDTLAEHIDKMKTATRHPWGVNLPLMYPEIEKVIDILIKKEVGIVFTSAGSPRKYTSLFHQAGMKVAHVVSNSEFARKSESAGVDAIVAEGFEAGGHNGRDELTTMCLVPQIRKATTLPLIAAGGISSGQSILAAMALGAEGVQIGTLFALSQESSASETFKTYCLSLPENGTMLSLKKISPTRLAKNPLFYKIDKAESSGAEAEELQTILGEKATKRGIFEGDVENGELTIGQAVSSIQSILPVKNIMENLVREFKAAQSALLVL